MPSSRPAAAPLASGTAVPWALLAVAGVAVYALLSHALMLHAPGQPWAVAVLLGPLWAVATAGAWRRRQHGLLVAMAGAAAATAAVVARGGIGDIQLLYVLQHSAIHAALAWAFASTLREGGTPLITTMAQRVHHVFTPALREYTGALTRLWAAYFLAMIALSWLLYGLAPWGWWSMFGNLLTPLAALTLFAGEHLWRRWRHPEFERVTLARVAQAWRERRHGR
ncbi:MAG: hypothetical protein JNL30_13490 [Rubrivivax sp.]|nr:hypothetical protein [Rubrivivax sp.]